MSDTTEQGYSDDRVRHEEIAIEPAQADELQDVGFRIETFISPKSFLPNRDPVWAMQNVATKPRGTRENLGRLGGWVVATERSTYTFPNGKVTESIWLKGDFTGIAVNPETGEVTTMRAANAILPKSMGTMIETHFKGNPNSRVMLDLELGVESLGKPEMGAAGYAYKITYYPDAEAQRAIKEVLRRQEERIARRTPKALNGPMAAGAPQAAADASAAAGGQLTRLP